MPRYDYHCQRCDRTTEVSFATVAERTEQEVCLTCYGIMTRQIARRINVRFGGDPYEKEFLTGSLDTPEV